MGWLEGVGVVASAGSVLLAVLQRPSTYPVGILGCLAFGWLFTTGGLYAQPGLQVVYVALSALGWFWWVRGGTVGGRPALAGLSGRAAVALRSGSGERVESVTTTQLLQAHGLRGWHLHQDAAGAVLLRARDGDAAAARASLQRLLGLPVELEVLDAVGHDPGAPERRTTCDLPGGAPV